MLVTAEDADGGNPLWLALVALCLLGALLPAVGSSATPQFVSESERPTGAQRIWLFLGASEESGREGFLRVVNHSSQAWTVRIEAVDDAGTPAGPVDLEIGALQAIHLNSRDLEGGNAGKGLAEGLGPGRGDWRLTLTSTLDVEALSYVRTDDGFVTSMHDTLAERDGALQAAFLNPGSNYRQESLLRLVNPGAEDASVRITGTDDAGQISGEVTASVSAGAARTYTAAELEGGAAPGLNGALGDGAGKWRLRIESDQQVVAMSLLATPTGHLTNLSAPPPPANDEGTRSVPLFLSAADPSNREGFMRVVNRSDRAGTVRIQAFDQSDFAYEPVTLSLDPGQARNFNSADLENGNPDKGLEGGTGAGRGDWRLELSSDLDFEAMAYVRTQEGFVTSMHDRVPATSDGLLHRVSFLNPGSNYRQASRLLLANAGDADAAVTIDGIDDAGASPGRTVRLQVPAGRTVALDSAALEAGGDGFEGALGDGRGKWRLWVASDRPILVASLLDTPTGDLANLSTAPGRGPQRPGDGDAVAAAFRTLASPTVQSECVNCHVEGGGAGDTRLVFVPDTDADHMAVNLQAFRSLQAAVYGGAGHVLDTIRSRSHGGGAQAPSGSEPYSDLQWFLTSLSVEEAEANDLNALLAGVNEIARPGAPGPLCVYGPESFPVVVGAASGVRVPVAAAGRLRAGRVVALGHDGYFKGPTLGTADTARFLMNALRWASGWDAAGGPRIGVFGTPDLRGWLAERGHDVVAVELTDASLRGVDVVAVLPWNQSGPAVEALSRFVRGGGGLVMGVTAWSWAYWHPTQSLAEDFVGNRLLAQAGVQWLDDQWAHPTSGANYAIDGPLSRLLHAGQALDAVTAAETGARTLTQLERNQATDAVLRAAECLPKDDRLLAPRAAAFERRFNRFRYPSENFPAKETDTARRLAAGLFTVRHRNAPAESIDAHLAASDFPGSVPQGAKRVAKSIAVDTTVPRWHSTGMYAAPGELVKVSVPPEVAADGGFMVRVGAHTDGIWPRAEWTRMPEISRRFAVEQETVPVANAFGGLVYLEVPEGVGLGMVKIEVDGAVEAPRFVLNETDPDEWRDTIRHARAPWAEIEGPSMIVTTRSSEVRELDDPGEVAAVWERVVELTGELAAWPEDARTSPERFVVDRQISNGYMHAGYPIMAFLNQQSNVLDAEYIRSGTRDAWGFFHEVGHNHQNPDWVFKGAQETSVNLFTLYVMERLAGIPVAEHERGNSGFLARQMARYDFDDPDFEQWKEDYFLGLVMYVQLQQAFGWDAFRNLFAAYLALPDSERPKSDDEKRDQWMVRLSREVGRNLGPFFEAWGIPTSQGARDSIADLPSWMPENFPPAR